MLEVASLLQNGAACSKFKALLCRDWLSVEHLLYLLGCSE